jgi:hypothetical protein
VPYGCANRGTARHVPAILGGGYGIVLWRNGGTPRADGGVCG